MAPKIDQCRLALYDATITREGTCRGTMSQFTGPLRLEHLDADWRLWRLLEPLRYEVGHLGSGQVVEVPAGFVTDGASVPRVLWGWLPAWGRWSRAATLHDYGYGLIHEGAPHPLMVTRQEADRVFYEAMLVSGVNRPTALVMWLAVRFFGQFARVRSAARERKQEAEAVVQNKLSDKSNNLEAGPSNRVSGPQGDTDF